MNEQVQLLANTIATKDDLKALDHKIELLRADFRTLEARLPWQIAAIMATRLGVFAAIFKLFIVE